MTPTMFDKGRTITFPRLPDRWSEDCRTPAITKESTGYGFRALPRLDVRRVVFFLTFFPAGLEVERPLVAAFLRAPGLVLVFASPRADLDFEAPDLPVSR